MGGAGGVIHIRVALKGEQTGLNVELTALLSGSDVLTKMDYKKLANELLRPLLYCQP